MLAQEANSISPDIQGQIAALLSSEIQQLEKLREILEQEKVVLGQHDPQQLENSTLQKRNAVSAVEAASTRRMNFVRGLGVNPQAEDWFEQILPRIGGTKDLLDQFDYLASLTSRCRSLNQVNGLLVNRRELLTSKVINILRANSTPEIYSNTGYSENSSDTRVLGKA